MSQYKRAFIGIGSNLDDPVAQVERAVRALAKVAYSALQAVSPLFRTAPIGQAGQPDYINAAVCLDTELPAEFLLDELQSIETSQGRVRDGTRWGSRTLDLDLLLYGDEIIRSARLQVPHPELANRAFVLEPLATIAPGLVVPELGELTALQKAVDSCGVVYLKACPQ